MTTYRGFAATPTPMLWIMVALFGVPAAYDVAMGLSRTSLVDAVQSVCSLLVGAFMLYCAVKARQGKRAELESRRTAMVGYLCFGLFILSFLAKAGATAVSIYA
jgi:peptidoglycan/LPS O-acetylase OafA/YrhL